MVLFAVALCPSVLVAQGLRPIPAEDARKVSAKLVAAAEKIEQPVISVEADATKANGVHVPDTLGVLIAPQTDLRESEELAAAFRREKGAAVGVLFLYRLIPIVNDTRIAHDDLHAVEITDDEGVEHVVRVLLLSVRHLGEDDYRLYGYGKAGQPIVDARFEEGTGPGAEPMAVEIKDPDEIAREGDVVVTVFGRYQAGFRVGHQAE
jgi:hypothetical protein